jgi:RNA polymerase sigma-70 factor (ECF subfamily)
MSLLESVARGDSSAFDQLYDRYASTLYALLLRILGDREDAREALQDAFVQVWNTAEKFDLNRGSEAAWLISIARSRGIDRLRARRTRADREHEAARQISIASSAVATEGGVPESMVQAEQKQIIHGVLADLPPAQRITLELAYFEGLSQSEIAQKLQEPLGTVKTRMQAGMKKLREGLREKR